MVKHPVCEFCSFYVYEMGTNRGWCYSSRIPEVVKYSNEDTGRVFRCGKCDPHPGCRNRYEVSANGIYRRKRNESHKKEQTIISKTGTYAQNNYLDENTEFLELTG